MNRTKAKQLSEINSMKLRKIAEVMALTHLLFRFDRLEMRYTNPHIIRGRIFLQALRVKIPDMMRLKLCVKYAMNMDLKYTHG